MNNIERQILETYVAQRLELKELPYAVYQALDTADSIIVEDILYLIEKREYTVPDEMVLSVESIDEIIQYGRAVDLDFDLGFESVLKSYVISELGFLLGLDLLEDL